MVRSCLSHLSHESKKSMQICLQDPSSISYFCILNLDNSENVPLWQTNIVSKMETQSRASGDLQNSKPIWLVSVRKPRHLHALMVLVSFGFFQFLSYHIFHFARTHITKTCLAFTLCNGPWLSLARIEVMRAPSSVAHWPFVLSTFVFNL